MIVKSKLSYTMKDGEVVDRLLVAGDFLDRDSCDVDAILFQPRTRTPPRVHFKTTEIFVCLSGSGVLRVNGEPLALQAETVAVVHKGQSHCFETEDRELKVVAICLPRFDVSDELELESAKD